MFKYDVCVIGGCGRVGLPLSIAFADKGLKVIIYDIDKNRRQIVLKGIMPFLEDKCPEKLKKVINKTLFVTGEPHAIANSKFIVVTIGTPVDEHLNPHYASMTSFFNKYLPYLSEKQYIILRSTVYPGTAQRIHELLKRKLPKVNVSFCPERLAEGKAIQELENLPQIISGFNKRTLIEVSKLFRILTQDIIILEPTEAELAKLFTNSWRYIQFATANQFYMLAEEYGLNYDKIFKSMTYKYPRTQGLPGPGFAAGPCLFKDTMQLSSFSNNSFFLGHSAMLVNEGLPNFIVSQLSKKADLSKMTVGILGMAFKANSDDERESLSFKLKRLMEIAAQKVYCSDPHVKRDYFIPATSLVKLSDIIIVAVPHDEYRSLTIRRNKILVDMWNICSKRGK